jgi:hypothetical protein
MSPVLQCRCSEVQKIRAQQTCPLLAKETVLGPADLRTGRPSKAPWQLYSRTRTDLQRGPLAPDRS